jgi:glycerophosphoryl diester phosphodiesterase
VKDAVIQEWRWPLSAALSLGLLLVGAAVQDVEADSDAYQTLSGGPPIIIGHRGASGYLPEHTLESYAQAIALGADLIEPDLVSTSDGVLIARHEPWLSGTTDIAEHPQFAHCKTLRVVDGDEVDDWFSGDFTLAEIKTLRAHQPFAMRDQSYNGMFEIPTFDELIALAKSEGARLNRVIGIYPEIKHPSFHREIGLPIEDRLLSRLAEEGWADKAAPIMVQSFEVSNLKYIRTKSNIRLTQLIGGPDDSPHDFEISGRQNSYLDMLRPDGLSEIATYADAIGIPKDYVFATDVSRGWDGMQLIPLAHQAGLTVHAYTFRNEERFRLKGTGDTPQSEYAAFYDLGIDGVFSDFPDTAREALPTR